MKAVQLQDVYDISQGVVSTRSKSDTGGPTRVIQTRNVNNLQLSGEVELIHLSRTKQLRQLRANDVLINLKAIPVRASVVTENDAGSVASSNIAVLSAKPDVGKTLDPIYLVGLLKSRYMDRALLSHMGGESVSSFNLRVLRTLTVPVPPLDKQLAFSSAFQALEQYVSLTQELIEAHTERLEVELASYLGDSYDK